MRRLPTILLLTSTIVIVFLICLLAVNRNFALATFTNNRKKKSGTNKNINNNNNQRRHHHQQQQSKLEAVSSEIAKSKHIPPSATSLANAFSARPFGGMVTTATTGSSASSSPSSVSSTHQDPQNNHNRYNPDSVYSATSPRYQEAFDELAAGNTTAVAHLHQLALEGDGHSQMLLGVLYGIGIGVPRDEARSKLYHSFAALNGVAESIIKLAAEAEAAYMYEDALPLAKRVAYVAARFNSDGTITPRWDASRLTTIEHKEATSTESDFDVQLLLAERGDARSCCQVGYSYMLGLNGVEQDGVAAQTYFERGIKQKEPACFSGMGQLYGRGVAGGLHPIARNPQLAAKYYKEGATYNHHPSLNGLGYLHAAGALSPTGERDFVGAAAWFDKSASLNSPSGLYNLGLLYLNGKGVEQNTLKAFEKFDKASRMGSLLATYQIGNMFAVGAGPVARNARSALSNYNLVQRLGPWNLRWNYARAAARSGHAGEALLHYLILGSIGRAKASLNAMFIIERFLDEHHPLVSFNGTSGDDGWRKAAADGVANYRSVLLHRLVLDAAKHGDVDAKLDLASHYWDGVGAPRNRILAKEAYHAAADEGNAEAMYMLGWLHSTSYEEQELHKSGTSNNNNNNKDQEENNNNDGDGVGDEQEGNQESGDEDDDDDEDEDAPRKRRISTLGWAPRPAPPPPSSSSSNNKKSGNNNNHNNAALRDTRDFALAKKHYDSTLRKAPEAWFAVRLALFRLNFLQWYEHFFVLNNNNNNNQKETSTASKKPLQGSSWFEKLTSLFSSSPETSTTTTTDEQQQQQQPAKFTMSLKQTYTIMRKLVLEAMRSIDPEVYGGFTLSDVLVIFCIGMLSCLLLIRHHAFGI